MDPAHLVQQMISAVRAERDAVRSELSRFGERTAVRLTGGHRLHSEPGALTYAFRCELEYLIPDGTRVLLQAPGLLSTGEVLDHDPGSGVIELVMRDDLGEEVGDAKLEFESTLLLDLLLLRLGQIEKALDVPPPLEPVVEPHQIQRAIRFLDGRAPPAAPIPLEAERFSEAQRIALGAALAQEVTYVWGPPGTGKTQTVGRLVHALVDRGERVLLAAHTNVAVDNALERVLREGHFSSESVVRVGPPGEALRGFGVELDTLAHRTLLRERPDDAKQIDRVCRELARAGAKAFALRSEAVPVGRRLRVAQEALAAMEEKPDGFVDQVSELLDLVIGCERSVVERAEVVATTLTRLHTMRLFRGFQTDAVIVDEASVASLVQCFIAGCCARKRSIAVGDFMQLPAIVSSEDPLVRKWLGQHVFASAGCDRPERDHPLRVMLDEQWRMHPQISAVVSRVFYGGRLKDAPTRARLGGNAVAIVDTHLLQPRTELTESSSKRNLAHADLIADLVCRTGETEVAVIAPYRAQVRAIREAIRRRDPDALETGRVEVFTVHRFQGRDRPLVVFDLVEAPGTECRFLDDARNPDAAKLINVALSRARDRLLVVGHLSHLRARLGENARISKVIAQIRRVDGLELIAQHEPDERQLAAFLAGAAA